MYDEPRLPDIKIRATNPYAPNVQTICLHMHTLGLVQNC